MIATFKTPEFVSNLKAALYAACENETRAHMNCVRIELADGVARFVSTNGHWLWLNDARYEEITGRDEKGAKIFGTSVSAVNVPVKDCKAILKTLEKGKKAANWDVHLDTDGSVSQLGTKLTFTPSAGQFPPYQHVVPSAVRLQPKVIVCLDPQYIAEVTAAFVAIDTAIASQPAGITIQPTGGELDPVVVTSDRSTALAVLMPRRAACSPQGAAMIDRYRGTKATKAA